MDAAMPDLAAFAKRLSVDLKAEWSDLVELTMRIPQEGGDIAQVAHFIASQTGAPEEGLKRKMQAIMWQIEELINAGSDEVVQESIQTIIALGQHEILSRYYKARRQSEKEKRVCLRTYMPGSLRDGCMEQIERIRSILGIKDIEGFWSWQYAQWLQMSEEELKHSAGQVT